jgi:uncharacterized membrane protein YgcG
MGSPWSARRWALCLGLSVALLVCSLARAQQPEEGPAYEIRAFDVVARLREDASLDVVETLQVHFFRPRHGIVRYFPLELPSANGPLRRPVLRVELGAGSVGDQQGRFESEDDRTSLRIGDPNVEVVGDHTYRMTYRLEHMLGGRAPEDSLRWFVTGYEWNGRIRHSSFALVLPKLAPDAGFTLEGRAGDRYGSARSLISGRAIAPSTLDLDPNEVGPVLQLVWDGPLEPGQGLFVEAHVPRGSVQLPAPAGWFERETEAAEGAHALLIAGAGALAIVLLLGLRELVFVWAVARARRRRAPDLEPARPLSVLEVVIMRDGRLTATGLRAALVDLSTRRAVRWDNEQFRRGNRQQLAAAQLWPAEKLLCDHLAALTTKPLRALFGLRQQLLETLLEEGLIRHARPALPWFRWLLAVVGACAAGCCWHWGLPAHDNDTGLVVSAAAFTLLTYWSKGWLLAWLPFLLVLRLNCVDTDADSRLYAASMLAAPVLGQALIVLTLWLVRGRAAHNMVVYHATSAGFWRWVRDRHELPKPSSWPKSEGASADALSTPIELFALPVWWHMIRDNPPSDFFSGGDGGGGGGDSASSSGGGMDSGSSSGGGFSGGGSDW